MRRSTRCREDISAENAFLRVRRVAFSRKCLVARIAGMKRERSIEIVLHNFQLATS